MSDRLSGPGTAEFFHRVSSFSLPPFLIRKEDIERLRDAFGKRKKGRKSMRREPGNGAIPPEEVCPDLAKKSVVHF